MTDDLPPTESDRLLDDIRSEFFLNPKASNDELARVGAVFATLTANIMEWYVAGRNAEQLVEAIGASSDLRATLLTRLIGRTVKVNPDNSAPHWFDERRGFDPSQLAIEYSKAPIKTLAEALNILDTDTGGSIRFNHHFIGELHPQGNLVALAASIVASFLNENAITPKVSPSLTTWEKTIVAWMWEMISGSGSPVRGAGRLVSGGTVANLTTVFIAVQKYLAWMKRGNIDPNSVKPVILISPYSHYSLNKAARIVGFGRCDCVKVPTAGVWRMSGDDLRKAIIEAHQQGQVVVMVSALAGATETGEVDALDEIANVIDEHNRSMQRFGPPIYLHVDAAYGGPFILVDRPLFKGIERADAITIDGHKYFYCNYPCGGILVRDESDFDYLAEKAGYLQHNEADRQMFDTLMEQIAKHRPLKIEPGRDGWREIINERLQTPADRTTLEGSRGVHGITQLYAVLKVFGVSGLSALLKHAVQMAELLKELVKATSKDDGACLELISDGHLNSLLVRFVHNGSTRSANIERDNLINRLIPYYLQFSQTQTKYDGVDKLPFYVGADQIPGHGMWTTLEAYQVFFAEVHGLNTDGGGIPKRDIDNIERWWKLKQSNDKRTIYALKAIVTHPYTDADVLRDFVRAILTAGREIAALLPND